jgi:hypothetical protein
VDTKLTLGLHAVYNLGVFKPNNQEQQSNHFHLNLIKQGATGKLLLPSTFHAVRQRVQTPLLHQPHAQHPDC